MNKFKINSLVVALVLLVPCLAFAIPGAHDPNLGNYTCSSCHTPPASYGNMDANYATNVCLRCHSSTGVDPKLAKNRFAPEDYSNPFNTTSLTRSNPYQTSHKWFGSDVVPAAGAQAPIDTAANGMNKDQYFVGTVFCARCHNVHGTSGASSVDAPYLRYPNDQDQMCLNCHRSRDTKDHTVGSHPVNVSYTSATVKARIAAGSTATTSFLPTPIANPTNPTGQINIKNGLIVCSTCHRQHNTDSRTGTFDPYSSTHAFSGLSSSKGYLLRVNIYGKTGTDVNVCTNCHVTKNHNLGLKNGKPAVQCVDCHSGHVEYDANAVLPAEQVPNVYLVRRYLQYTTAGRINKRILYRSTATKEFGVNARTGVCQSCHNPPLDHFTGGTLAGAFPEATHADCSGCHAHNATNGAFSYGTGGSCTNTCHGLPPTTSVVGSGTNGPASGYTTYNEATTPHKSHAAGGGPNVNDFDCNECHNGSVMPNGIFNEVFKAGFTSGKIAAKNGANPTYTAGGNCSNVYCHSNGRGVWKSGMNPVQWGNNKQGSIVGQATECVTCHDDPNSSSSHTKHIVGMGYGCVTCHAYTVSNNTTLLAGAKIVNGTHTNGVKDVYFSGVGAAVGTYTAPNCATVACHSNGKGAAPNIVPSWGTAASGACGACHWTHTTSTVLSTGSHTKHFGIINNADPLVTCANCHVYTGETAATHVDGTLNVTTGCSTCHADPYGPSYTTPTWGTSSSGCGACHNGGGAFTGTGTAPATGAHNKHMAISGVQCNSCHTGTVAGSVGGTYHTDGNIDVTQGYPANVTKHAIGTYVGTCSTVCHSTSTTSVATPSWGVTATCVSCHTTVQPITGSHTKHMALGGAACNQCHAGTVQGSDGGTGHLDGNIDVIQGYPVNVAKHAANTFTGTCSTACHSASTTPVSTPVWGTTATCVSCHTTVQPTTGTHTRHMAVAGALCNQCHAGTVQGSVGGTNHGDGDIDVTGGYPLNVAKHAVGSYTGTCSTTCHATSLPSPVWGTNTTFDFCTKCHGTNTVTVSVGNRYVVAPTDASVVTTGKVSANAKTGAHQTHLQMFNGFQNYSTVDYRCQACHGTLPTTGTITHADGTSSPQGKFNTLATKWGAMTATYSGTTCANTYCHNPAGTGGTLNALNAGTNTSPSWTDDTYIADGTRKTLTNCNKCHKVPGEAGFSSGFNHNATSTFITNASCLGCHGHDGDTAGTAGRRHMDGIKYGGGVLCNDCHGFPPMSAADLAARVGGTYVDAKVEDYANGGGHHAQHLLPSVAIGDGAAVCLPCHPYAGLHNQGGGVVSRANVQVNEAGNTTYSFDSTRDRRYNTTTLSCSNVSCHFQPTPAWAP